MLRRTALLLTLALLSSVAPAQTQPAVRPTTRATGGPLTFRTLLTHAPTAKAVPGLPLAIDPFQSALARGTFALDDTWTLLEANDKNSFQSRHLRGGWAYAEVESDADRVMLLRAAGHTMVYVNGEPRAGDVYSAGYLVLPVKLKKGKNTFLFQAGRGELTARLEPLPAPVVAITDDLTLPDLLGGNQREAYAGVVVINGTDAPTTPRFSLGLSSASGGDGSPKANPDGSPNVAPMHVTSDLRTGTLPLLPPMSARKVPIRLPLGEGPFGSSVEMSLSIEGGTPLPLKLAVRKPTDLRKVTFASDLDGSVQYYALRPATGLDKDPKPAIVLSLHGASVEASGQANAYASKSWAHIVCPTNRRPFGFDWEEWGRLDALEVLAHAKQALPHNSSRIYLTGHSMGGHGTYHLAANHPGLFAAAAPSAGWISFASYSPQRAATRPADDSPAGSFRRATLASDTLALKSNLLHTALYLLHGDADDNVPVTQARTMAETLATFHHDWTKFEQPGAGHWWSTNQGEPGATCVDFPAIFDLFARRRLPAPSEIRHVAFTTASPAIHSRLHWAEIVQQERSGEYSSVDLHLDPHSRRISGSVTNVRRLEIDARSLGFEGQPVTVDVPSIGARLENAPARISLIADHTPFDPKPVDPAQKTPARAGPLKLAFQNRFAFLYATAGTPEENALSYQTARYWAESWYYRANGSVDVLADTEPSVLADKDRTLVLFGNADTHALWSALLKGTPIQASRTGVTLKDVAHPGNLTALFCYPRPGSDKAMVIAIAPTTPLAARAHVRLPVLASGIGWPDYTVLSANSLEVGEKAIEAAGFFNNRWELP